MAQHDLKPEDINPTGPNGIITKGDVLEAIAGGGQNQKRPSQPKPDASTEAKAESKSQPQPKVVGESQSKSPPPEDAKQHSDKQLEAGKTGPARASQASEGGATGPRKRRGPQYTDIPNSQIRKIIAQRLLESKQQIPATYVSATADIDAVASLRQSLKDQGQKVCTCAFPCLRLCRSVSFMPVCHCLRLCWNVSVMPVSHYVDQHDGLLCICHFCVLCRSVINLQSIQKFRSMQASRGDTRKCRCKIRS